MWMRIAFYCSVEMQRNPALRDKPVAVCGSQSDRHGIVLTANYKAKPWGVKTGQCVWEAKQHCPELIILPPDYAEYVYFSQLMRGIFNEYTDQVEPFGLDEAWCDVTGSVGLFGSGMSIAKEISARIKRELGITVSIGVANNKIFSKLGSDYKKPDAITRIEDDNWKEIVYPLPIEDLLYVGPATSRKLRSACITTIGRLAECPEDFLIRRLGKMGGVLSAFARGLDTSPVLKTDHIRGIKSVGNSATTPRDLVNDDDVRIMLYLLSESVALRLRELGSKCTVVEISVRDSELHSFTRQRKIMTQTYSSSEIAETAFDIFKRNYTWSKPIRSVGVRGSELVEAGAYLQLSAFEDDKKRERWERIDESMDKLRAHYGYMIIQRAIVRLDPELARINPSEHTIHPVGYFYN